MPMRDYEEQDIINPVTGTVDYKTGDVMIYTDCY